MTDEALRQFLGGELDIHAKWRLFEPVWPKAKHTGYCQAVRLAVQELFGEPEIDSSSYARIDEKMQALARPGFYRQILAQARIESCQVNALEAAVFRTETDRGVLLQDLSFIGFTVMDNVDAVAREVGIEVGSLADYLRVIDAYFEAATAIDGALAETKAASIKDMGKVMAMLKERYAGRLDFAKVPIEVGAVLFDRKQRGDSLSVSEERALQDCLFHYCVRRAIDYRLPIKLHTGYYAGHNGMPLARVAQNPADLCPLLRQYPEARFVLMHIGYPYQDEMIALGKQYANAFIDLCWAWIINPAACVRFVAEFLTAAPLNKLLGFGGDYIPIEPVVGHARIARRGLALALTTLVDDGWMSEPEASAAGERVLRENARELFPRLQIPSFGG